MKLNKVRKSDPRLASTIVRQILDNTLLTAGMLNDPKSFIARINKLMVHLLKNENGNPTPLESQREVDDEAAKSEIESILNEIKEEEKKKEVQGEEIVIDDKENQKVK